MSPAMKFGLVGCMHRSVCRITLIVRCMHVNRACCSKMMYTFPSPVGFFDYLHVDIMDSKLAVS